MVKYLGAVTIEYPFVDTIDVLGHIYCAARYPLQIPVRSQFRSVGLFRHASESSCEWLRVWPSLRMRLAENAA
jgi:hypothetical protein